LNAQSKIQYHGNHNNHTHNDRYDVINQLYISTSSGIGSGIGVDVGVDGAMQHSDIPIFNDLNGLLQQEIIYNFICNTYIESEHTNNTNNTNNTNDTTDNTTDTASICHYNTSKKIVTSALIDKILIFIQMNNINKYIPYIGKYVIILCKCKYNMLWLLLKKKII